MAAWFAVQQNVFSGKLRELAEEIKCSQNEAIGLLCRLWSWGLDNAEKDGRIKCANEETIAEILSVGKSKGYSPIDAVHAMIKVGWIDREKKSLYIHDWDDWQGPWYKALERREKDTERKRKNKALEIENQDNSNEVEPKSPIHINNVVEIEKEKVKEDSKYSKSFEEFWKVYPRKIDKGNAYKKYQTRRKDGYSDEDLILAAINYAEECKNKGTSQEYIKHAKTFLSDSTPFVDYLPKSTGSDVHTGDIESVELGNPFADFGGF